MCVGQVTAIVLQMCAGQAATVALHMCRAGSILTHRLFVALRFILLEFIHTSYLRQVVNFSFSNFHEISFLSLFLSFCFNLYFVTIYVPYLL